MIHKPRWINAKSIFDIATGRMIRREGYWYTGPVADATAVMFTLDETGYAFYNNDGTEATATIIGSINAPQTILVDTIFHIRLEITETGDSGGNANGKILEFDHQSAGFVDLTTSSSVIQAVGSLLTDGNDSTQRLGGGGLYDSTNNWVSEDATFANNTVAALRIIEAVCSVQIVSADVSDGEEIIVRMAAMNGYSSAGAVITVSKPAGGGISIPVVMHHRTKNFGSH